MQELLTNTATRIPAGPFVDATDGKTAETALTVTGITVEIYRKVNDGGAVTRTAFSPTATGGDNDMVHITSDVSGMYDLELTAAQLNWLGTGRINFFDASDILVHWEDISVVSANYWNHKYGTGNVNADVLAVSGDTTAADNLEADYDGTGYAKTNSTIGTATAVTNTVGANIVSVSGDTVAADNLEADYDGTGYAKANSTIGTCTVNTDMRGTNSALLAASAPANFGDLAITVTTGQVTVGTNADKTDYLLATNGLTAAAVHADAVTKIQDGLLTTASFPTNFADLAITATTGQVTVGTNADKTGYQLDATGVTAVQAGLATPTNITQASGVTLATNGLTAAAVHADAVTKIQDGIVADTDLPANFSDLAITVTTGQVTVGTNNDKTNYALEDNAIGATKIADGALTAAKVATTLPANVTYVNSILIGGAGTELDPWGPA